MPLPPFMDAHPHAPLVDLKGLTKDFPGIRALDGVSLAIRRAEVHGVIGETRAPPSAETHEGHGHRDGHVDAHHADFDLLHEGACSAAIARGYSIVSQ